MKNPLSSFSDRPNGLLARGISQTARTLGYPEIDSLRQRALDVLRRKKQAPLSAKELQIIEDCLTSQSGGDALALINHRLFCDFDHERILREQELLNFTLGRLGEFEQGGQSRHRHLEETGDILTTFAQYERNQEPKQLTAQELWNYIQLRQSQAVQSQNKKHFAEACLGGKTNTLYVCQNTETPTQLRYDPEHQIIGGWNDDKKIIGNTVIGGLHPVAPAFFGDEITVPCADKSGKLNLVEFNPHGFFHFGNMPRSSISVIPAKNIGHRNVVKNINPHSPELFYCFVNDHGSPKVIHSGPGRTVISNKPIREFRINNDVVFLAHESSGSCAAYRVHSLQTGGYAQFDARDIESQKDSDNDIIFTFRESQRLSGTLFPPGKEQIGWELGKKWWKKKSISLSELTEVWHEAAGKAKEKESK